MIIVKASNVNLACALRVLGISKPQPVHFIQGLAELTNQFQQQSRHQDEPGSDEENEYLVIKLPKNLQVPINKRR